MVPIPTGVWSAVQPPATPQSLAVVHQANRWTVRYGGDAQSGPLPDLHFGNNRLRLWLAQGFLRGYWIQPPAGGTGNAYATPVAFKAAGLDRWQGTFTPLNDAPEIHFVSLRDAKGEYEAFVRDPIANVGASVGTLRGASDDNGVRWSDTDGKPVATYDATSDKVRVTLPDMQPIVASRDNAPPLDAAPAATATQLLDPGAPDSYWTTGTPESANMDGDILKRLATSLVAVQTTSVHSPYIQSMIVARGQTIVFERYFFGWNSQRPHDLRSASKSITPILMGVAMNQGARIEPSMPVMGFFHYASYANDSKAKQRITIGNALAMDTGLACDDYDDKSPGGEDEMQASRDWYKFILDLQMHADPGAHAAYCSGGLNLVNGAIASASRQWTARLFYERLAAPLGLTQYYVPITPNGEVYGGGGFWMRPRDFMRFGRLYVQHGVWNGKPLLAESWIAQTIALHSTMTGDDTYGYGWHLRTYQLGARTFHSFEAGGNGGQLLAVFPDEDLTVMMTAANYGDYRAWKNFHDYITGYVLSAVH